MKIVNVNAAGNEYLNSRKSGERLKRLRLRQKELKAEDPNDNRNLFK
jgi:hypothetical protein